MDRLLLKEEMLPDKCVWCVKCHHGHFQDSLCNFCQSDDDNGERPHTYMMQQGNDGPIKIGRSSNVSSRLFSLQQASPYPINLLLEINGDFESAFHQKFRALNVRGEWFYPSPWLLKFIESMKVYDVKHSPVTVTG